MKPLEQPKCRRLPLLTTASVDTESECAHSDANNWLGNGNGRQSGTNHMLLIFFVTPGQVQE